MSAKRIILVLLLLAALAGSFIGGYLLSANRIRVPPARSIDNANQWLFSGTVPLKGAGSLTFNSNALFESDIPLPPIDSFQANVKFMESPSDNKTAERVVAYIARIHIVPLDKKDIPAKYLREVVEQREGGPVIAAPLEQVTYVAQLKFELLDRDGFNLLEITGPEEWLQSGTMNVLQRVTTTSVPVRLANRIVRIRPHLYIIRCESCRAG